MTVSSIVPVNNHKGNSSNKQFDFDFLIENENELVVSYTNSNGVIKELEEGIDYSIHQIGNKNGSYIIFPLETSEYGVLKEDEQLTLSLSLTIKQESEFKNSSYFNFEILEWTFDYIVRILQIIDRKISRCLKVNEGSDANPDNLMTEINNSKIVTDNAAKIATQMRDECVNNKNETNNIRKELNGKISEFNTTYEKCLNEILDKGIDTRADVEFSNITKKARAMFVQSSYLSNCITDIPEKSVEFDEMSFTIKSGLKVLLPDGRNADGTIKSVELILDSDKTEQIDKTLNQTVFIAPENIVENYIFQVPEINVYVQESQPEPIHEESNDKDCMWYCPSKAKWQRYNNKEWSEIQCTPILKYKIESDEFSSYIPMKPIELLKRSDKSEIIDWSIPDYNAGVTKVWTDANYVNQPGFLLWRATTASGSIPVMEISFDKKTWTEIWTGDNQHATQIRYGYLFVCPGTYYKGVRGYNQYLVFYPLKGER